MIEQVRREHARRERVDIGVAGIGLESGACGVEVAELNAGDDDAIADEGDRCGRSVAGVVRRPIPIR